MRPAAVDAILFDLGGTLRKTTRRDDQEKREYAVQIQRLLGSELPLDEFTRTLSARYQAYRRWAEGSLIELGEAELWTRWLAPDAPDDLVRAQAPALNRWWREALGVREVYPEAVAVVTELHRRGYLLGVVSNTISRTEVPLALEAAGIARCFKAVLLSSVFGVRKPDPAMLLAAAEKLGVSPACCAYIGNRVDRDVVGAHRAGFSTVIIVHHGHHPDPHPVEVYETVHDLHELLEIFPGKSVTR
jgi:putative hydrolase of the HAD superfamily